MEKNYGHVYDNITGFAQIKFSSQVTKSIVAAKIFSLHKNSWMTGLSEHVLGQVEVWETMEKYPLLSYMAEA